MEIPLKHKYVVHKAAKNNAGDRSGHANKKRISRPKTDAEKILIAAQQAVSWVMVIKPNGKAHMERVA